MAGKRSSTRPSYSFDDPSHTPDTPFYFTDHSSSIAFNTPTRSFDATSIPFTSPSSSSDKTDELETRRPYATSTNIDRENIIAQPLQSESHEPGNATTTDLSHITATKNTDPRQQSISHHRHRMRPRLPHPTRQHRHKPYASISTAETNYGDLNESFARLDGPGPRRIILERSCYRRLYFTDTSPSLVFVGNLTGELDETDLQNHLEKELGPVVDVKIMRDKNCVPLGFAMVEFENACDGQRAISILNDMLFHGRRLLLQKYRTPAPIYDDDPSQFCHLFVTNLPNNASFTDMKRLFTNASRVIAISLASDLRSGLSQNTGLVTFSDHQKAHLAIQMFQGYEWNGCKISITEGELPVLPPSSMLRHTTSPAQRRKEKMKKAELKRERKGKGLNTTRQLVATKALEVAHPPNSPNSPMAIDAEQSISPHIPDTDLNEVDHGKTVDELLGNLNDRHTRSWMQALPPETAEKVIAAVGTTAASVLQNISPAQAITTLAAIAMSNLSLSPRTVSGPGALLPSHGANQIRVTNLPLDTTSQDLIDLFVYAGPVVRTETLWHEGQPRGEGLVRFEDRTTCEQAIERFNGYGYGGQELKLSLDDDSH
ncbi:hypothetical protein BCR42DRAFT_412586 [Absidia repens]|uniref:RRM domain-containing protein n=1 Tax=Absidia repens TaxID=90262 RepID=A0A1X2IJU8_9FUNG|nr:hypothetical protein BCR42DRAFT_412586 [Absidia repens]